MGGTRKEDGDNEEGELNIIEYDEEDDYVDHQSSESHHIQENKLIVKPNISIKIMDEYNYQHYEIEISSQL